MPQWALTGPTHSPDGEPTHVPSNIASEGDGTSRTGGGNWSELPSNMTWRENRVLLV